MVSVLSRLREVVTRQAEEVQPVSAQPQPNALAQQPLPAAQDLGRFQYVEEDDDPDYTVSPVERLQEIVGHRDHKMAKAGVVSVVLHMVAIVAFCNITFQYGQYPIQQVYTWVIEEEVPLDPPEPEFTLAPPDEEPQDQLLASLAQSIAPTQNDMAELQDEPILANTEVAPREVMSLEEPPEGFFEDQFLVREGTVGEAQVHVDGAVDHITHEIMARLERGPVLVIWLMDASVSLIDERNRVADRLVRVYDELGQLGENESGGLLSAVVGFGLAPQEVVAPTVNGQRVLDGIRSVAIDQSGVENTFGSVIWSVDRYKPLRTRDQRQTMVVVWTDESGDDYGRVEDAVHLCSRLSIPVFTVGPSAMFGRQLGYRSYVHPEDNKTYQLPIHRGPDTPFQELLKLPYWFEGSQLEVLHAGIGPFALTRLALETGGAYFINDQKDDAAPFSLEAVRAYMPQYVAAGDYLRRVQASPLRQSVLMAVQATHNMTVKETPQLEFAPTGATYQEDLRQAQMTAAYNLANLPKALAPFGNRGMEEAYQQEKSPRWRAWYDLTRGRLLAMLVRNYEYNWACAMMKAKGANFVEEKSNRWTFKPTDKISYSSTNEKWADEAKRLLERCIDQNPDTPWALLAARELEHGFGFEIAERFEPPPPPPMRNANPNPNPPPPPPMQPRRRTEQPNMIPKPKPVQLPKL